MADGEANITSSATDTKKTFWYWVFSWPVSGAASILFLGFGGSIMTSPHPYIADAFCILGIAILLVKFWTWEESKHENSRKTARLLLVGTLFLLAVAAGLCFLSSYLSRPSQLTAQSVPMPQHETPSAILPQKLIDKPKVVTAAPKQRVQPEQVKPVKTFAIPSEVIQPPPIAPTQTVNVDHGIGGIGGTYVNPTVNNFAPPQREITKSIEDELIAVLKRHPATANIRSDSGDDESHQLAQQLFDIFVASDWKPISIGQGVGQALPREIQLCYYGSPGVEGQRGTIPADRPEVQAIALALINSGVKHVTVVPGIQYKEHTITINIGRRIE